jgi:hypothetical protein
MGNKHCFRNEKLNGQGFVMSNEWQLPETGTFEFDYVNVVERPQLKDCTSQDKIDKLVEWFRIKYEEEKCDIKSLVETFSGAAEFLVMRSE